MIQVTIFRDKDGEDGFIRAISIEGHAEYAQAGEDIVCAGVSALALNFLNSVEAFTEDAFDGQAGEAGLSFSFSFPSQVSPESKLLMSSLVLGLKGIEEAYGEPYINIRFEEV